MYSRSETTHYGARFGALLLLAAVIPLAADTFSDADWRHRIETEWYQDAKRSADPLQQSEIKSPDWAVLVERTVKAWRTMADERKRTGQVLSEVAVRDEIDRLGVMAANDVTMDHYRQARTLLRQLALSDPLLDFDDLLFVQRAPGSFTHMSDQYYGWWSRPGGGFFILRNFKSDTPELKRLAPDMEGGSFLRPDLSPDGGRVLFAWCRHYDHVASEPDKVNKASIPEDAFYHVFELDLTTGSTRQLTRGRYDDFDARYLPGGEIVFLSTRRGQFVQSSAHCATSTLESGALPDSYVRCGGDNERPVAVYTLHVMDSKGGNLRALSPFENFEWNPSVASDGRIFYARWDYIDRDNMPYMSLWSTHPDGTHPTLVYGNFTHSPHAIFEARSIPGSHKLIFTASGHHSITGGSLVLLDPDRGTEGEAPLTRLTPEICFPEIEGWPASWYSSPFPLSEQTHLVAWSHKPLAKQGRTNPVDGSGLYLFDAASGHRELLFSDPDISSFDPIPLRSRPESPHLSDMVEHEGRQEGTMLLLDVYEGLSDVKRGSIRELRIVGVPPKTQPHMNSPILGLTRDDPGKYVLGTAPVESDGSAHFRVPSGVNLFFQALDKQGRAVQTMRSVSYVQPGQTVSCVGCHEHRATAPRNFGSLAARRPASRLRPPPEGAWPLRFDQLVQPVLDQHCVRCHDGAEERQDALVLNGQQSYEALTGFGSPSLRDHIQARYHAGSSIAEAGAARTSELMKFLGTDPVHRELPLTREDRDRFHTWMDTYAQRLGSFSAEQEQQLARFRVELADLLDVSSNPPRKSSDIPSR